MLQPSIRSAAPRGVEDLHPQRYAGASAPRWRRGLHPTVWWVGPVWSVVEVYADLAVAEVHGRQPALLPEREGDEVPELDQLRLGEVLVQPLPQRVVGAVGIPDDDIGPLERGLLALVV